MAYHRGNYPVITVQCHQRITIIFYLYRTDTDDAPRVRFNQSINQSISITSTLCRHYLINIIYTWWDNPKININRKQMSSNQNGALIQTKSRFSTTSVPPTHTHAYPATHTHTCKRTHKHTRTQISNSVSKLE